MELSQNIVKDEQAIKDFVQNLSKAVPKEKTAICETSERGAAMDRCEYRWCDDSSNHSVGCIVYLLLDKHRSSSEKDNDSRTAKEISIQTPEPTSKLDNDIGKKICESSHSVNSLLEIKTSKSPSDSEENFVWSIVDRFHGNQNKDVDTTTEFRLKEPAYSSTGREWESVNENKTLELRQLCRNQCVASVIPVEARPSNKDACNFNRNTKNSVAMRELSADNNIQYEKDLPTLLNLLKDKYPFQDETNKNILHDYEIERFAELYNITNFCPVLSYYDSIFWLKDHDGVIYMWSRIDEMMIRGGCDMKEALINFLFHQENLCYIKEYTHDLISIKEAKDKADKWYEENKKTEIVLIADELLRPLNEEKKGSKKGGKQKKKQKKNKKKH